MGNNNDQGLEKVEQVSIEGCHLMTGDDARSLRQWGVEVQWVAAACPVASESHGHNI
jgi:hypothetical protein